MEITFKIISRGTLSLTYGTKETVISGELTFDPPIFYANLNSLNFWFDLQEITASEKAEIITILENSKSGTKIIF